MVRKTLKQATEEAAAAAAEQNGVLDAGQVFADAEEEDGYDGPMPVNDAVWPDDDAAPDSLPAEVNEDGDVLLAEGTLDDRPAIMTQKTIKLMPPAEMADEWQLAANVDEAAAEIIERHDFSEYRDIRLACFWKRKGGRTQGHNNYGGVTVIKGAQRVLARYDVILWLAADHLEKASEEQIRNQIVRCLCMAGTNEEGEIVRLYPEATVYAKELAVAGAHNQELAWAKARFEQAPLITYAVG